MKTENEVRNELIERCNASTQTAVARELEVSVGFLHDVITGRNAVTRRLASKLGYRAEIIRTTDRKFYPLTQASANEA